jgi:hypothetical protein
MEMSTESMRCEMFRLSNRFVFSLLIVVAVSACAVSNGRTGNISHEGNASVKNQNTSTPANDGRKLEFVVSVDNKRWKLEGPMLVKLRVHNAGDLPVQGICSFALTDPTAGDDPYKEGRNLWAPVIVQAAGVEPAPGPASTMVNPGESLELEVDLTKLNWASMIQSDWPSKTITGTRAAGAYEFSFRMHVKTAETSEKIESNIVKVSIL